MSTLTDEQILAELEATNQDAKKRRRRKKGAAGATEAGDAAEPEASETVAAGVAASVVDTTEVSDVAKPPTEDGEDKKKKKKKKDKKDATAEAEPVKVADKKDDKSKGKGPGKKALAAMHAALSKIKEEEAARLREEEERILREEEEERLRLEHDRKMQELRDKKKAKERARKEKLKKEGKLLTPKQRADQLRAMASLEMLKKQGLIQIGRQESQDGADDEAEEKKATVPSVEKASEPLPEEEEALDEEASDEEEEEDEEEDEVVDSWEDVLDKKPQAKVEKSDKVKSGKDSKLNKENAEPLSAALSAKLNKMVNQAESETDPECRSPIICVLGHVDTGKTKLLDYLRKTHVQDNEAGGITQQIGATFVPPYAIEDQCKIAREPTELTLPGLLIIDTPGHESFTNLRSRGSSLCDIAILVIDIMHGLEPQTIESINLLKARKTPFLVALNKIDRLYDWRSSSRRDVEELIKSQAKNTRTEFERRTKEIILQLNEQALNAALYYENDDIRSYVSLVPTSAAMGDGMGNMINLMIHYCQTMLHKKLLFYPDKLEASVLEVKALPGLGTTIDVVLVNGRLREGDRVVLAGHDGPIYTQIRSLLVPQPLRELRVKTPYQELKMIKGAIGVKICGHDLEKAVAGLELYVVKNDQEAEKYKSECWRRFGDAMKSIKLSDKGVYVQASTLGSLEALLEFLKVSKIPYAGIRIGPVVKRDVMKASTMLEMAPDYAVVLAFDVKVERDAQELADSVGLKIFTADIIYHLFDKFTAYTEELRAKRKEQYRNIVVFPCKLRILPNCVFNARDPIVVGVSVEDGILMSGTPIAVPSKDKLEIGRVSSIEVNHKQVESARKGQEVCIKIEHCSSDAPKLYGRHFDHTDILTSRISRESIDACKEYFRDELIKSDWQLMIELKKAFEII
jgi:translation initiation factor 5B